jgi:pimeloyl-ACP methyl ester carboxylesterase
MSRVTSKNELPMFFPVGEEMLFGILTEPASEPRGVAVVVLSGGGTPLSTSVNALSVHFCRRIAGLGFHALRFDYHGVGESSGLEDRFNIASPFVADLKGAIAHLRSYGLEKFVLVGSCFGARTVLAAAPKVTGLIGAVLISPPIRDFEMGEREVTRLVAELSVGHLARRAVSAKGLSGLLKANRRRTYARLIREKLRIGNGRSGRRAADRQARYAISPRFLDPLRDLLERGLPVLFVYGDRDDFSREFDRAAATSRLGEGLRGGGNVASRTLSGTVHGFTDSEVAETVFDTVTEWIVHLPVTANRIQETGRAIRSEHREMGRSASLSDIE